jgi:hypothetical protein
MDSVAAGAGRQPVSNIENCYPVDEKNSHSSSSPSNLLVFATEESD